MRTPQIKDLVCFHSFLLATSSCHILPFINCFSIKLADRKDCLLETYILPHPPHPLKNTIFIPERNLRLCNVTAYNVIHVESKIRFRRRGFLHRNGISKLSELTTDLKKCKSKEQEWRQQTHFDILKAIPIACETNSTEIKKKKSIQSQ